MIFKLGLTGSMGMGKTSTALLFQKHNCGVWDADKAVHRLYSKGGAAVKPIQKYFPGAVKGGSVSREELKKILKKEKEIIIEELKNSGKDTKIVEKITLGKLNKFISENTLLNQEWILEPKKRVKDILKAVAGKDKIEIKKFIRFKVGEGI